MQTLGPLIRINRLKNLHLPGFDGEPEAIAFIANELDIASQRLNINGANIKSDKEAKLYWKNRLIRMCDGHGLRKAGRVPNSHRLVREPPAY